MHKVSVDFVQAQVMGHWYSIALCYILLSIMVSKADKVCVIEAMVCKGPLRYDILCSLTCSPLLHYESFM